MFQYKKEHTGWVVFVVGCKTKPSAWSASASTRCGPRWCLKYSSTLPHFFSFQIEDLVVKSILCGLTSLKEEMNTGQKKEVPILFARIGVYSFCYSSGEVNIQHLQAAGLRHPAGLPPATSLDRGERQTSLPPQPPGRLRQQTHGEQNTTWERMKLLPVSRSTRCSRSWATTSPWTASPTWRGRTPLAASSTFQMCQVGRRVLAFN